MLPLRIAVEEAQPMAKVSSKRKSLLSSEVKSDPKCVSSNSFDLLNNEI